MWLAPPLLGHDLLQRILAWGFKRRRGVLPCPHGATYTTNFGEELFRIPPYQKPQLFEDVSHETVVFALYEASCPPPART